MEEKTKFFLLSPYSSPRCPPGYPPPSLSADGLSASLDSGISCFCSSAEVRLPRAEPWELLDKFKKVQEQLLLLYPNLQTLREANNYNSQQNKAVRILLCAGNEGN